MSLAKIKSAGLSGIDGYVVDVQTDISNGMPAYDIVGLPDASVREARERTRSAIRNVGAQMSTKRITINLAPASYKKEGSVYDLPIAVSILCATEQIKIENPDECAFIGELSLDGSVNSVAGVLPMVISLYKNSIKTVFVPKDNAAEAAVIEGCTVYPVGSLADVIKHFKGDEPIQASLSQQEMFQHIRSSR